MTMLEEVSDRVHHGYFVDLFVRVSNVNAISMYYKVRPYPMQEPLSPVRFCTKAQQPVGGRGDGLGVGRGSHRGGAELGRG